MEAHRQTAWLAIAAIAISACIEVSKKVVELNDLQYSEDAAVMQKTLRYKQETQQSIKETIQSIKNQLIEQRSLEEAMLEKVSELEVIVGDIAKIEH